MQRSSAVMAVALALFICSLIEVPTLGFTSVACTTGGAQTLLRGAAGVRSCPSQSQPFVGGAAGALRVASAALSLVAASLSMKRPTKANRKSTIVQMRAGEVVVCYCDALIKATDKKKESVEVAQDAMKISQNWESKREGYAAIMDIMPSLTDEVVSKSIVELFELKSTVMPKFISFLLGNQRIHILQEFIELFIEKLYEVQNVRVVVLKSAEKFSSSEVDSIKEKMQARLKCKNLKIVEKVAPSLMGGFTLSYDFEDSENLTNPSITLDFSLSNYLSRAAVEFSA